MNINGALDLEAYVRSKQKISKIEHFVKNQPLTVFFVFLSNSGDPRVVFTFEPQDQSFVPLGMVFSVCTGNLFVGKYLGSEVVEINPRCVKYQ